MTNELLKAQDWDESEFHIKDWTPPTPQQRQLYVNTMMLQYGAEGGKDFDSHRKMLESTIDKFNQQHGEKNGSS